MEDLITGATIAISGFLAKAVSDYFSDSRLLKREQFKIEAETKRKLRERRLEGQQAVLEQAQASVHKLARNYGLYCSHVLANGLDASLPQSLDEDLRLSQSETYVLSSRVLSEKIYNLIVEVKSLISAATTSRDIDHIYKANFDLGDKLDLLSFEFRSEYLKIHTDLEY